MAEVKFTPGPWLLSFYEDDEWCVHGTGIHGEGTYAVADVINGNGDPQNEANAHLIAASPALYEALRNLVVMLPSDCPEIEGSERVPKGCVYIRWQDLREARAALALAEGKKE